jgi:hypothetical protein
MWQGRGELFLQDQGFCHGNRIPVPEAAEQEHNPPPCQKDLHIRELLGHQVGDL